MTMKEKKKAASTTANPLKKSTLKQIRMMRDV